jgi:hypothetical protein
MITLTFFGLVIYSVKIGCCYALIPKTVFSSREPIKLILNSSLNQVETIVYIFVPVGQQKS